ncbi:MAG: hypothetical protein HFH37_03350 [Lachnospiraceae bacterium]|jgi:predicted solute-binding protein|nr:hypothetical protein [Lachnospiraceae bacterium]
MSTLEICLLVVGIVLMIASFFITEKLSNSELKKLSDLSTNEMQKILERSLNDAQVKVDNMVDQVIDHSIEKSMEIVERALDKETNEKMRVLTEYSDTVLESINKTHNEVMFLYSMLNDKHSELTKYAGNLAQLAIHLEELEQNVEKTLAESDEIIQKAQEARQEQQVSATPAESVAEEVVLEPEEAEPETQEEEQVNHNQLILEKYKDGKSAIEIARELGLGVGEVRLVIGLFREEEL